MIERKMIFRMSGGMSWKKARVRERIGIKEE